jgi:hypothetical protein
MNKNNRPLLCLALGLSISLSAVMPAVQAQVPTQVTTSGQADNQTTPSNLQGAVATTEANAEATLGELEQTAHQLKEAANGAYAESQRVNTTYVGGPEVLGAIVIQPVGLGGFLPNGGYLPPRKKWIDYYSMHVGYLAPQFKKELDEFVLPSGSSSDTTTDYQECKKLAAHLLELCDKMVDACKGPKYDNMTIAMAAGMLDEELKRYDKIRKDLSRDIKEDFRHVEKVEKQEVKQEEKVDKK